MKARPREGGACDLPLMSPSAWEKQEYLHCIVTVFLHFSDVLDSTYCILIAHINLFMYLR